MVCVSNLKNVRFTMLLTLMDGFIDIMQDS